jgi:hypothetical protein
MRAFIEEVAKAMSSVRNGRDVTNLDPFIAEARALARDAGGSE